MRIHGGRTNNRLEASSFLTGAGFRGALRVAQQQAAMSRDQMLVAYRPKRYRVLFICVCSLKFNLMSSNQLHNRRLRRAASSA